MVSHRFFLKRVSTLQLTCRICGDRARGFNFDVLTCMSCKAFFRRNALCSRGSLHCKYNGLCSITKQHRKKCAACRLQKCFTYGMKIDLIRTPVLFRIKSSTSDYCQSLPLPQAIHVHSNDCTSMNLDEWNHLSKIIYAYDRYNSTDRLQDFLCEQMTLPIKLRAKRSMAMNFMYLSMQSIINILKQSLDFQNLSNRARRALIRQNIYLTSYLNGIFLGRCNDLWHNVDFQLSMSNLFSFEFALQCTQLSQELDSNGLLMKVLLVLLLFSSNYSTVIWNDSCTKDILLNSSHLLGIQDFYVKLLWKYLIYQYGFTEAILRYLSLIRIVMSGFNLVHNWIDRKDFQEMIEKILCQTEHDLIVEN